MPDHQRCFVDRLASPIGELVIVADDRDRLRILGWDYDEAGLQRVLAIQSGRKDRFIFERRHNPCGFTSALRAYFQGNPRAIDDLVVEGGGTPFQRTVWAALREIPCGSTVSYGELARRIGRPAAVRAVGLANGSNPVAVVVPCHRVIGSNGTLTGYGGGLERKRWLLEHEGAASRHPLLSVAG